MPVIHIHAGEMSREQKAQLGEELTTAANKVLSHIPREAFTVIVHEHGRDSVAVGGQLLSDRDT